MLLTRRKFPLTLLAASALPKSTRYRVAFHYAARSAATDLQFLSNFDIVVTGAILADDQRLAFSKKKTRLVTYAWSSGHYPDSPDHQWTSALLANRKDWLLAGEPVGGGAAAAGKAAWWYDFGSAGLIAGLTEHLRNAVQKSSYSGVFLDTLGSESLPPSVRQEFQKRHSSSDYDQRQGQFLAKLKDALGADGLLFTNQGYRKPELFLAHADFDLVENSFTELGVNNATKLRPWREKGAEWQSIETPMNNLIAPAAKRYPKAEIVHLNYVLGKPEQVNRAVQYCFAAGMLWNQFGYIAAPGVQKPIRSNLYFTRLGQPLSESCEQDEEAGVAWRTFENGLVALNSGSQPFRIRSLKIIVPAGPRAVILTRRGRNAYS